VSVAIAARYEITFFVLSVLPAPDSPLYRCQSKRRLRIGSTDVIRMLWFSRSSPMFTQALSAIAKMCGGFSSFNFPRYWCIIASE
jgi:hypothetical protein